MLSPTTFSGSSNPVVDRMNLDPLTSRRIPIWDDNGRTQDIEFTFYIAKPDADGVAYSNEMQGLFSRPGVTPGAVVPSSDRSFDGEIRGVFEHAEAITHSLKFSESSNFASSNFRVGIDTNTLLVHPSGGPGTGLRGFAFTAGGVQDAAGNEVVTSAFNDQIRDSAGNNIFSVASEQGGMAFRPRLFYHEIGHSLGLDHPFSNTRAGRVDDYRSLGFDLNDNAYTVMTSPRNPSLADSGHGFSAGYMALDVAALQAYYGVGDNNPGNTTYNLVDGAQITDPKALRDALDIDGNDSRNAVADAFASAQGMSGIVAGLSEMGQQFRDGTIGAGSETLGRAYRTIYDGQRKVDAAGNESIGNGGDDTISYAGSQQSAFINLNDATLGAEQAGTASADAGWTDLSREIQGSDRWSHFNAELRGEIDASIDDPALRTDGRHAGGFFSKLYETNANGDVTQTQNGGYSIANGVIIENASGGEAADTIIGNEHNNRLDGKQGADVLYGGHGDDQLNGGRGHDTLIAGRGNNTLDGGADIDTASYRDYYDPSVSPSLKQGVTFSIIGNDATITKPLNGAPAAPGPVTSTVETDTAINVERFEGSERDDVFTLKNLSGNLYIQGGGGNDSVTISDPAGAYTLDMTGGTYPATHPRAGEAYSGTVSDGSNTVYLEGFKAGAITIDKQPVGSAVETAEREDEAIAEAEGRITPISIEDAASQLQADIPLVRRDLEAQSVEGSISPEDEASLSLINSPMPAALLGSLAENGVEQIDVDAANMQTPIGRVNEITASAADAFEAGNLPAPNLEAYMPDPNFTQSASANVSEQLQEEALEYGPV